MPSRFASSVDMGPCQHGPCQPGRVRQKSLMLLRLLLQVLLLHEGTNTRCRVAEGVARQRQRCVKRARSKKAGVRHSRGKLGQSKASGDFLANRMQGSTLISPIYGSNIICCPNMTNLPIRIQSDLLRVCDQPSVTGEYIRFIW